MSDKATAYERAVAAGWPARGWAGDPAMTAAPEKRRPGRPRTGVTPNRTLRVGPVWDAAAAIAAERGETITSVITRALERYVVRHRGRTGADDGNNDPR